MQDDERARLIDRIRDYVECGEDRAIRNLRNDLLDNSTIAIPSEFLQKSYELGGILVDSLVRTLQEDPDIGILTVYGMQASNLKRRREEVEAFLNVETHWQERWSEDSVLRREVRFRIVGDRTVLEVARGQCPELSVPIARYLESVERVERDAPQRPSLTVNILAPYDYAWELEQATRGGRFDPAGLAVPESVDLVIRTGGGGRSLASGALPLQTAFSPFDLIEPYFPDCALKDFQGAILGGRRDREPRGQ